MAEQIQRVVQISPDAHAAQEIAAGLAALEKSGKGRNNNIAPVGGVFGNASGNGFHNANGEPVNEDGSAVGEENAAEAAEPASEPAAQPAKQPRKR